MEQFTQRPVRLRLTLELELEQDRRALQPEVPIFTPLPAELSFHPPLNFIL